METSGHFFSHDSGNESGKFQWKVGVNITQKTGILKKILGCFPFVFLETKMYNFDLKFGQICSRKQRIFNETVEQFSDVFVETKLDTFDEKSGRFVAKYREFLRRCQDISGHIYCTKTEHFGWEVRTIGSFPDPNQMFFVPVPNHTINRALLQH